MGESPSAASIAVNSEVYLKSEERLAPRGLWHAVGIHWSTMIRVEKFGERHTGYPDYMVVFTGREVRDNFSSIELCS